MTGRIRLASVAAATLLIVSGTVGALAATGDLPWQGRAAQIASDGTAVRPTATAAASPAASGTTPAMPEVTFSEAFPRLPKLERPTNMVGIAGGWMVVTLQDGRVVSFPDDPSASELTTMLDFRSKVSREGNEEGLLGIAFPSHASNGDVYLYYSAKGGERRTVLSAFRLTGDSHTPGNMRIDAGSEQILLTIPQPYSNHKGGQLAFGPDGMLYLGLGDGGSGGDPNGNGQDLQNNLLGSILRIDVRGGAGTPYSVPSDNPFASSPNGAKPETWIYGLRNPWRFSFDTATGLLWIGDVGQGDWEEIDRVEHGGGNYGWNIMEGFHCFKPGSGCNQQGLELPVVEYGHDNGRCSVTGGYVYRGQAAPSLRGWYVYGDYCSGEIWGIPATSTPGSRPEPILLANTGKQIPTFAQAGASNELYFLSFDGRIYEVS